MKSKSLSSLSNFYRERFGFEADSVEGPPQPNTSLIIVIPCADEPDLRGTLQSLAACEEPLGHVETIVVINASRKASEGFIKQNTQTFQEAQTWINQQANPDRSYHLLRAEDLPPKHAGVGMARKIGMDEAFYRWASLDRNGPIVALDADCRVAPNYLTALEELFANPKIQVSTLHFEHRKDVGEVLWQGIQAYELHLRYYVQALRFSGFPRAFHTVGSAMALRAERYARSGGMNRRKAGEDFYFLHKVIPLGGYEALNHTIVYPSSRISERVPFGTGRAQLQYISQPAVGQLSYPLVIFEEIKGLLEQVPQLFFLAEGGSASFVAPLSPGIQAFLAEANFGEALQEIKSKSTTPSVFLRHFFAWMDGFRMLKLVHFLRDYAYPEEPIEQAARTLLARGLLRQDVSEALSIPDLLAIFRKLDRSF